MPLKPLDDIRVLAFEQILAAPYCSLVLADLGAEVIKVEPRGTGEQARHNHPLVQDRYGRQESSYFLSLNRNKKSVTLDLKKDEGKELFLRLARASDVVLANYRPGTLERLGLGYDVLRESNPGIIYVTISGFGYDDVLPSPYASRPAFDIIAQAMGGLMSINGPEGGPPTRVGTSLGDIGAGLFAATGILAALNERHRTGRGKWVDVSMVDAVMALVENAIVRYTVGGHSPAPVGNRHPLIAPFDSFQARDGMVVIAAGNDRSWRNLCRAMEREDLLTDPRFADAGARLENHRELKAEIEEWTRARTRDQVIGRLLACDCPAAPVSTIEEVVNGAHSQARRMILSFQHPVAGHVRVVGSPIKFLGAEEAAPAPPPLVGEHTDQVLQQLLGLSGEEVERLRREEVI